MELNCANCKWFDAQYVICEVPLPQHLIVAHDTSEMAMGFDNKTQSDYYCALHKKVKPDGIQPH